MPAAGLARWKATLKAMRVLLAAIRKGGSEAGLSRSLSAAARFYLERIRRYELADSGDYASEELLLAAIDKLRARTAPVVAMLDSRGKSLSSEELAAWIGRQRDGGVQNLIFAVGAGGWSVAGMRLARSSGQKLAQELG